MIAASLLLVLQTAGPPVAPGAAAQGAEWIAVDGVLAVAGDRVITRQQWDRSVQMAKAQNPVATLEQEQELRFEVMRSEVMALLTAQAGEELEVPAEMVEAQVRYRREMEEDARGVVGYRDALEASGIDPLDMERATRDQLYRGQWEAYVVGDENYAGGRPEVDRFIRPGELRTVYRLAKDTLSRPETVTLQVLELNNSATGGQENSEAMAAQIFDELEAGASFREMVDLYSAAHRETDGVVENVPVPALIPALKTFIEGATPGAISEALPLVDRTGGINGVQIVRLLERQEGEPPPEFRTPTLQRKLRDQVTEQREQRLLEIRRLELARNSYSWIHPMIQPPARPQGR
ncbi:peptidylprolyl isomerase [Engelhardtia mirabilis]